MKIVVLQDYLRYGGTERQAVSLSDNFQQDGHAVTLLTFRPGGRLSAEANARGIHHVDLQPFDTDMDWFAPGLLHQIKEEIPDVILCMGRMANGYGNNIQKHCPKSLVVCTSRTDRTLTKSNIKTFKTTNLKAVVASSKWWAKYLVEKGVDKNKIHSINSSITRSWKLPKNKKLRTQVRSDLKATPKTFVLLNISTTEKGKKQSQIIQSCAQLDPKLNWNLWLIGGNHALNKFAADKLGIADKIKFIDYQSDPYPYYLGADLALTTSQEDSQSTFIIEAQALGLPVVAYNRHDMKEYFENKKTGFLIPEGKRSQFVSAIAKLATDPSLRKQMHERAIETSSAHFSSKVQSQKYLKLFKTLNPELN